MRTKTERMSPTVIPAQPGFRCATFYLEGEMTDQTTAADLEVAFEPIIGWLVAPMLRRLEGQDDPELIDSNAIPLLVGGHSDDRAFVVDPHGWWIRSDATLAGETTARKYWLEEEKRLRKIQGASVKST